MSNKQKKEIKMNVGDFFTNLPIEPQTLNLQTNCRLNLILPTYLPNVEERMFKI